MPITSEKYKPTSDFKPRPPGFNWGGLIVFLLVILAIVGMGLYQNYFK
jgi:hypothetical protein